MRFSSQLVAAVLFSSLLLACGTPRAGESCNVSGFLCESSASALECVGGTWVSLPCKGANGCSREGDVVKCDMTGNAEGDNCASSAFGKGLCTADGLGTLECRQDPATSQLKLVKTNTCRSCTVNGNQVICQP
jgi:hypothetical protein